MMTIKFGLGEVLSGSLFGLIHLTAACLLPTIGNFVDRNGGITMCMVFSAILGFFVNALWLIIPAEQCTAQGNCLHYVLFPIVLSGISYALCAGTAWNGTFYLIERHKVGFACGLQSSMMSILLLTSPIIFGSLVDRSQERDHGYYDPMLF